ncbi:MAG: LptF/LptG family permease [Simkania negevensis]|nr:LptF/LptG family permease [Simkania negevensis]
MSFSKLWQRYLLKEILKVFFLFLFLFYLLHSLIDYSMHMQEIVKEQEIFWLDFVFYYLARLSEHLDLLLPLALLVASIKVLTSLNKNHELLAFQTGGISLHRFSSPFFLIAFACSLLTYANFEYFTPFSLNYIEHFERSHFKRKKGEKENERFLSSLSLEDGTTIIYQRANKEKNELFDLFWILSADEVWHMQKLLLSQPYPQGFFVDHLKRSKEGEIEKVASYENLFFKTLSIDLSLTTPFEKSIKNRSISELFHLIRKGSFQMQEHLKEMKTHLYFKLIAPFFTPLALIGVIPFSVRFNRHFPLFLLFSLAIFSFIAFCSLIDGFVILGETQLLPPYVATFSLPFLAFLLFGRKFLKMGR